MFGYFIIHTEKCKNNEEKMYLEMLQDFIKQLRISDAKIPSSYHVLKAAETSKNLFYVIQCILF